MPALELIMLAFLPKRRMIGTKPEHNRMEDIAMTPSPSPDSFPVGSRRARAMQDAHGAADLESMARLVEHLIPKFKDEPDRKFYREVVQTYRTATRDILRGAWSDDQGQDIAEYAVMLAVILVIVVGTIRLIGSNANTVFSQAASSIQ
jgi:Flp pilus assembly pilin Flp